MKNMFKNKNKKLCAVLIALMFLFASVVPAFAMPNATIVMGNSAYSLDYAAQASNYDEIVQAFQNAGFSLLYKNFAGKWQDGLGNDLTEEEVGQIPSVVYKNVDADPVEYAAGDGDEIIGEEVDKTALSAKIDEAKAKVEADYTAESWAALATALTAAEAVNTNTEATQEEVDTALANLTAAIEGLVAAPAALAVESVSAIKANQIKVTFNKAVEDTSKAVFELKLGSSVISLKDPVWNEAKTEATLERASSNFLAGDYTLTVKGLTDEPLTGTVKIEAQKVASIEIIGDNLVKASDGKSATVSYVVKDQYGDDITKTADVTPTASKGTAAVDKTKKIVTVSYDFTTTEGQTVKEIVVTLVNSATGTSATKTLNVAATATVATFELGDITYPEGKTRIYAAQDEAAKIAFTAKDQYGSAVKADPTGAVQLLTSDANVATFGFAKASDGTYYIKVTTKALTEAKSVTLTAVVVANGSVTTKTIDVVLAPKATTVEFGALSKDIVALGDTVYMDVVVYDQFGTVMAPKDYVGSGLGLSGTASLSGAVDVVKDKADPNYGKIVLKPTGTVGTATVVSTLGGKTVSKNIDVKAARVVSEVNAAPAVNLIQGAEATLKFVFRDQYGDEIKADKLADNDKTTYKIKVEKVSGDDNAVTLINPADAAAGVKAGTDEADLKLIKVQADPAKTGKFNVTVELIKAGTTDVLSSALTSVSVTSDAAEGLTYSIVDIPTLVADKGHDVNGKDPYAQPIKIKAVDKNGTEVAINPDQIRNIEVLNDPSNYLQTSSNLIGAGIDIVDAQEGHYVIAANKRAVDDPATGAKVPTNAKVRVTLNTAKGVQILESNVISFNAEAPMAQELKITNKAVDINDPTKLPTDAKTIGEFEYKDLGTTPGNNAIEGTAAYISMRDQYGIWTTFSADAIVNSPATVINMGGQKFSFNATTGKFALDGVGTVDYAANTPINLSVVKDGVAITFTVKITDVLLPPAVDTVTQGGTVDDNIAPDEKITVTFNKDLSDASQAAIIAKVKEDFKLVLVKGEGSGNVTADGKIEFKDAKTLEITAGTLTTAVPVANVNGGKITLSKDIVKDVFGNKATTDIAEVIPTS